MIGKSLLHYNISEKLGKGGIGMIYKAHDTKLDRDVAIKVLHPSVTSGEIAFKCLMRHGLQDFPVPVSKQENAGNRLPTRRNQPIKCTRF